MLPVKPVSAVDTVGPAIEWTKRAMFRPFQWAKWWRIALVGMLAGELQSGGCSSNFPSGGGPRGGGANPFPSIDPAVIASIIAVLIVGGIVLVLVHMYIASVCRFMLFDAVTTGRYRLRESWSRWHDRGLRWFGFNLAFLLVVGLVLMLVLVPFIGTIVAAKRSGMGAVIGAVLVLVPVFLVGALIVGLFYVLAKDFAVPMVALENEGVFRAFGRVLRMVRANLGDYAGYIGIKIVLAIAYSIVFGIAAFIIFFIVLVPIVIGGVAAGVLAKDLFQNPVTLAVLITVFLIGIFVLMFLIGCVFAPAIFFFQAYVYTWYAQRYEPLWNLLYPPAPQPPPTPAPVIAPPEPPPLPAV
jgi:hypothetical protein